MKLLYIYRNLNLGFSIGKVFRPIEKEMKKFAEVDSIELPCANYSLQGLCQNIKAIRKAIKKNAYDVIHITGTEHYLIPFLWQQSVVVTIHDLGHYLSLKGVRAFIFYLLHILPIGKAKKIVCISNYTLEELSQGVTLPVYKLSQREYKH